MRCFYFLVLYLFCLSVFAAGETDIIQKKTTQLSELNSQIEALSQQLDDAKEQSFNLREQLQQNETAISKVAQTLEKLEQELTLQTSKLEKLQDNYKEYQLELIQQRNLLNQQLQATYILGQRDYLKLFLSQQDPSLINRSLTYSKYLSLSRLDAITRINQIIAQVDQTKREISAQVKQLQQLNQQQRRQQQALEKQRLERQAILKQLTRQIHSRAQQLLKMLKDKQILEQLIDQIKSGQYALPEKTVDFTGLRGKLPWPTQGNVVEAFGESQLENSELRRTGIVIDAKEGQPVYAVASGRVVFANWLQGYGFLMILDHGDGYMTLYGRNQSLFKRKGEWVNSRDSIASAGQSGGFENTGLYFEIRANGKPLNPQLWLQS